jgi:hypothetical protein
MGGAMNRLIDDWGVLKNPARSFWAQRRISTLLNFLKSRKPEILHFVQDDTFSTAPLAPVSTGFNEKIMQLIQQRLPPPSSYVLSVKKFSCNTPRMEETT